MSRRRYELIDTTEAARRIGGKTNPKTVARRVASGEIPGVNVGGDTNGRRYRIREDDLQRWIDSRKVA